MTHIAVSNRYIYHYSFVNNWPCRSLEAPVFASASPVNRRFCVVGHQSGAGTIADQL
jgi:hypothetical protein